MQRETRQPGIRKPGPTDLGPIESASDKKDPVEAAKEVPLEAAPVGGRASKKQRAATDRNAARVLEANKNDEKLTSIKHRRHLPKCLNEILPEPVLGPDDAFEPGKDFLQGLAKVASTKVDPPEPSPMHFSTEPAATAKNDQLLSNHGFDLDSLSSDSQDTTLGCGSEFRPIHQLQIFLGAHPEFQVLKGSVEHGMDCRFKKDTSKEEKLREL
jgi:hypothetical protein